MMWLAIAIPLLIFGVIGIAAQLQASGIKQKFADLGTIAGRTRQEIIAAVGNPTAVSTLPEGKTLLQWQTITSGGAYHIALQFDQNDICEGITHEYAS